jgi:signal transduction histidine kinase
MVVVLFAAILLAALNALRYTRSAVLSDEKKEVAAIAQRLARAYEEQTGLPRQDSGAASLPQQAAQPSREALSRLSRTVLEHAEGVEGGFYWSGEDSLVGYAFPAYLGVAEGGDVPASVKPAILEVSRESVRTARAAEQVFIGLPDVILIEAVPIGMGKNSVGSAWAMKRLSGIPGSNRLRAYLIALGLGLAALLCLSLTLLVVRNLQQGVRKIEGGLKKLEGNLSSQIQAEDDPEEIQRIATAINRMGVNLKQGLENEKQIENRLRHSERLAALGRLVAAVAHEVRNPLATIRLRVQMCEQAAKTPAVQESCAVALEEIERLNGMVNRLLSFSQPVQLHPGPTELSRLLEQRLAGFQDRARQHAVNLVTDFSADPGPVYVDQNRMAQVFDNVIQNAIEAMGESGGTLYVIVTPARAANGGGPEVSVEFQDTGKGMSPETAGRIFDPFFTTKASGTGLGLSICHELVRAHGGEIHVQSVERRGTRVRIVLPVRNGESGGESAKIRES